MRRTGIQRQTPLRSATSPSRPRNTGPTAKVRALVYERDGGCVICGGTHHLQLHHRRPRALGGSRDRGTNLPSNLIALCPADHRWVETDPLVMRKAYGIGGWKVKQGADPALVRVLHHRFGSGFLTEAGGWSYEPPAGFTPQGTAA